MTICNWCKEPLKFIKGKGWVHQDGKLYKTKIVNGVEVDDHCALAVPESTEKDGGK